MRGIMKKPILIIHGGACSKKPRPEEALKIAPALEAILQESFAVLKRGGSALAAAVIAVELLEDNPLFNAGTGSKLQSDGVIRMSSSVMDGKVRRFSGIVNVKNVKNPIRLAEKLQREDDRVLADFGADAFAREKGFPVTSTMTDQAHEEYVRKKEGKHGTVGAVAMDRQGRIAVATSTGGRGFERPGRVSDTPTVAATFASRFGGVSATGVGERIVEFAAAAAVVTRLECGLSLKAAVNKTIQLARKERADFGLIALDAKGNFEAQTATPFLIYGVIKDGLVLTSPKDEKYRP